MENSLTFKENPQPKQSHPRSGGPEPSAPFENRRSNNKRH